MAASSSDSAYRRVSQLTSHFTSAGDDDKKAVPEYTAKSVLTADFSKPNNPVALHAIEPLVPSSTPSRNSGGTAHLLPAERKKATFNVKAMTDLLNGGEENTKHKKFILSPTSKMDVSERYYWDRAEYLRSHLHHFVATHKKFVGWQPTRDEIVWMQEYSMLSGSMMNHFGLFLPTLLSQGSDEQIGWWLLKALSFEIIGCYAQTELGHGSNVRGLQTIAEYDKSAKQFVLNTPTLTSMKWWPGTLGKVATHALVYAQLILDGKEYGVHVFMLQIRDENHRPLPGIEVGDLGPKIGDHSNDTGFMRMKDVRIPREHMLCKWQSITEDGQYKKSAAKTNDKVHYATMMFTRGNMVRWAGGMLARGVTIATRYSAVRLQGFVDTSTSSYRAVERQILDHQVQRYRILKQLALCYAMKFVGAWMVNRFAELEGSGEKASAQIVDTSNLPEIAATAAGLKAFCTALTANGLEDVRKCCGGNGYLLNSGVAQLSSDYLWQTTAEGDFVVLMLQTARFLLKSLEDAKKGKSISGPCDYLTAVQKSGFSLKSAAPPKAKNKDSFFDLTYLLALHKHRALVLVVSSGAALQQKRAGGLSPDDAWNACSLRLCDAVRAHCSAFLVQHFASTIDTVKDAGCRAVLHKLCALYALSNILDEQWAGSSALGYEEMELAREATAGVLDQLRPDAVALVDSFEIPDRVLNSTIGREDGNVYESLFEGALKSSLNQVDPYPGYEQVMRPHLDIEFLQKPNKKFDE